MWKETLLYISEAEIGGIPDASVLQLSLRMVEMVVSQIPVPQYKPNML